MTLCLRPAALVLRAVHAILRPELERDANDLVTLLQQKRRRGGGINSTAHATDHALALYANLQKDIIRFIASL